MQEQEQPQLECFLRLWQNVKWLRLHIVTGKLFSRRSLYMHKYVCIYICAYIHIYMYVCVCRCVYIYLCIYIHILDLDTHTKCI